MSFDFLDMTLGEFVRLQRGHDLTSSEQEIGSVPIMGSAGQNGTHSKSLAKGPGVVIGRSGASAGRVHFSEVDYWPHNTCLYVTDFLGNNPLFVYYFLQTLDLASYNSGSAQASLNRNFLYTIPIRVPTRVTQDRVAEVLKSLDDRAAMLCETNATLEAIAQALFKSWFVNFDPVYAKLGGDAPKGIDEATAALFPKEVEELELGVVPKGWKLLPFGHLLSHTIGGDWGSDIPDEKNDTRVAIIRGTDLPDLQSGARRRVPIRYTSKKKLSTRRLEEGDIILEVSGGSKDQPTGRALYFTSRLLEQFDCPVEPASFCRLLRPKDKGIGLILAQHLNYIYRQGKTWEYQNQSTGIANFQTTHFLETEMVVVPPKQVIDAFFEIVEPLIHLSHHSEIQDLGNLRDALLPWLISGKLDLAESMQKTHLLAA